MRKLCTLFCKERNQSQDKRLQCHNRAFYLELKHESVCNNWTCGCAIAAAEAEGDLASPFVQEYSPIVTFQRVPWGPTGLWAGGVVCYLHHFREGINERGTKPFLHLPFVPFPLHAIISAALSMPSLQSLFR